MNADLPVAVSERLQKADLGALRARQAAQHGVQQEGGDAEKDAGDECGRDAVLRDLVGDEAMRNLVISPIRAEAAVPGQQEIEPLDAIEWTPQAGIETGGNKRWHDMYKRILAAGKSVQVVNVELNEVQPLLDILGPKGVYMLIQFKDEREAEQVLKMVEPYY